MSSTLATLIFKSVEPLALAAVAARAFPAGVLRRVLMPVRTMSFRQIPTGWRVAVQKVINRMHWLKMVWPDTKSILAEMIQLKTVRNWPDQGFISPFMGNVLRAILAWYPSAIKGRALALPKPTGATFGTACRDGAVLVYTRPETYCFGVTTRLRSFQRIAVFLTPSVMRATEANSKRWAFASFNLAHVPMLSHHSAEVNKAGA